MIRLWSSSSMRSSFSVSSSVSLKTGMPVQVASTSAISSSSTSESTSISPHFHLARLPLTLATLALLDQLALLVTQGGRLLEVLGIDRALLAETDLRDLL